MLNVIDAVVPIALLIALGAALRRYLFPSGEFWRGINALAYNVLFPALLVDSLARTTFGGGAIVRDVAVVALASALVGVATFVLRPLLHVSDETFSSVFQGATRFNSYVFLAVAQGLFGAAGTALAAVVIAVMLVATNVTSVAVLDRYGGGEKHHPLRTAVLTLQNPIVVAGLAGVLLSVLRVPLHPVAHAFLYDVGGAALPLSLLAVGAGIRLGRDRGKLVAAATACLMKLVILPLATFVALRLLGAEGLPARIALLYAALPCAGNAYTLALEMGGDEETMASIITISTLASIVTITVLMGSLSL